jgi:HEAT repeat protein
VNPRLARASWMAAAAAGAVLCCAPAYDAGTLFNQLESGDLEERQEAAEKIEKIVRGGNYDVFMRGIEGPVKSTRAPSIIYLSRMTQPKAREALRDLLRVDRRSQIPFNPIRMKPSSEEADSRILVAHLIAENGGDPGAVDALIEGMQGQPPDVLEGTCYALGALRDPKGLPFLATMVRRPDVEVVRAAVQAVGIFHTPEARSLLKSMAGHPSQDVRSEVLSALQMQADPSVVEVLETMAATDPSPELRVAAMGQLGRFKDRSPVPFLIDQLKGKDDTNRQAALDTLRLLSGQSYGPRPEPWTRWWEQSQKPTIARP